MKRPWWARPPRWASWLASAALVLLAACGPGVGGSGTGEDQSPSTPPPLGAAVSALCASDLAPVLACPGTTGLPGAGGTDAVAFSGRLGGQDVALQLQGNEAELRVGCTLLRFRGQWAQVAAQAPRFYGYTDPDGQPAVATLEARAVGSGIELTLRDASGGAVFGPIVVTRGEARTCN